MQKRQQVTYRFSYSCLSLYDDKSEIDDAGRDARKPKLSTNTQIRLIRN